MGLFSLGATEKSSSLADKGLAALLYAASSIGIMMLNKFILTTYGFPSYNFLAIVQYAASLIVLLAQRWMGIVEFPAASWEAMKQVFPLPIFFLANTLSGLGATKRLNMPMFVLLRRFSIVMTMLLEMYLLGKTFKMKIHVSIVLMIAGALIAAAGDFHVDALGYTLIMVNDLFTALQGVVLRKKMDEKGKLSTQGLMFYNNLLSLPVAFAIMAMTPGEFDGIMKFRDWQAKGFIVAIVLSAFMGFAINYSYYLCTKVNSPLTTTVIGCLKNVLTSYMGMIFRDYHYSHSNFAGVNVSVFGSLIYQHAEWQKVKEQDIQRLKEQSQGQQAKEQVV